MGFFKREEDREVRIITAVAELLKMENGNLGSLLLKLAEDADDDQIQVIEYIDEHIEVVKLIAEEIARQRKDKSE